MNKLGIFIGAAALSVSLQANAAFVSGEATVQEATVTTTGTASFTFTQFDFFIADALVNDGTPFYTLDTYDGSVPGAASLFENVGNSSAAATASSGYSSSSLAQVEEAGLADATTASELEFEVDGTGTITLSLAINLTNEITDSQGNEYVESSVYAYESLTGGADDMISFAFGSDGDVLTDDLYYLTLVFDVDGFDIGFLAVETAALADSGITPSAVPVPAAVWLLGSALFGFLGFSKRRVA